MGNKNRMSWTLLDDYFEGASWNPFVGCSKISAGCKNCYAIPNAAALSDNAEAYRGITVERNGKLNFTGVINRQDNQFEKPTTTKIPHIFFLNSMSDFFHPGADDEWRLEAIDIMRECNRHLFQLLTKRTDEAIRFFERHPSISLPRNVWLGATVEDAGNTHRIDEITTIPAEVHWLSLEPLLGPIQKLELNDIDWVIVGGESGRTCDNRRPMKHEWVVDIQQQCNAANVPFFFKQWGHWTNNPLSDIGGKQSVENRDTLLKGGERLEGKFFQAHPSLEQIKSASMGNAKVFNEFFV